VDSVGIADFKVSDNADVAYLKDNQGDLYLVNIATGELFSTEASKSLHTDATGTYTAIVDLYGIMDVYFS